MASGVGETALGDQKVAIAKKRGQGRITALYALPGTLWLGFYLIAPLVVIVLVSFWTRTDSGFVKEWTTANYSALFSDSTYWNNMLKSFVTSLIAVALCLALGFPIAYYLTFKVKSTRNQVALFIIAMAPFWTSFLTRSIAWTFPLMGREGALNQLLLKIGIIDSPVAQFGFSYFSVRAAMVELYILFMITPLFFMLAQVDRSAIESARDLGANTFKVFKEVIIPQIMPGVVIGAIFIFVLTMGEYGTVSVIGGNTVQSVGTTVYAKVLAIQYPQGAASAVLLVLALIVGVFVITRFANLREPTSAESRQSAFGRLVMAPFRSTLDAVGDRIDRALATKKPTGLEKPRKRRRYDYVKWALAVYFVLFLIFIYAPSVLMGVLSFQSYPYGRVTFPFKGPGSLDWYRLLFDNSRPGSHAAAYMEAAKQSVLLAIVAGIVVALIAYGLSIAFRRGFRGDGLAFYVIMLALMTPGFLLGVGTQVFWKAMGFATGNWETALGANAIWGIPFGFLVMLAVWNRYDVHVEEASRDLGASPGRTFREVTLPLIWTGLFGCFLFGFTLTWNDYDRSYLLTKLNTLPVEIYNQTVSSPLRPDLYALGTITTALVLVVIALILVYTSARLKLAGRQQVHSVAEEFGIAEGLDTSALAGEGQAPGSPQPADRAPSPGSAPATPA